VSVPFSTSYHNKVEFELNCYSTVLIHSIENVFVDYSVVNWDDLNNYLCNVNWSEIYAVNDKKWSAFSSILNDAILQFVPTRIKCIRKSAARSYPHHIRKLISKKPYYGERLDSLGPNNYIKHIVSQQMLYGKLFMLTPVRWRTNLLIQTI